MGFSRAKYMGNTSTLFYWMWNWYIWHRIHQCHTSVNMIFHIVVGKILINYQEHTAEII